MKRASRVRIARSLRLALPAAVLATVVWSAAGSAALPAPEELVPNTVMRISDVPYRLGVVTKAELRHALVLAAAAEDSQAAPKPGVSRHERRKHSALAALLEAVWLKGQAAEMGIVVTRSQVLRELAFIKEVNFESASEYREFLREARFTRRDVYERVELQLLALGIQKRILAGVRSRSEEEKAFDEFVREFNERWRSRTVCAPAYLTERCSNGPD